MITKEHRFDVGFTFYKGNNKHTVLLQPNEYDNQNYYVVVCENINPISEREISCKKVLRLSEEEIIYLIYDEDYTV